MSKQDKPAAAPAAAILEQDKDALIAELKARLADFEERATRPAATPLPGVQMGTRRAIAKCAIQTEPPLQNGSGGVFIPVGAVLPWDPEDPPRGFDGLVEGVHFEYGFVASPTAEA